MSSDIHHLELEQLGDRAWNVRDRTVDPGEEGSVVAEVQQRHDGWFDVSWVAHGVGGGTYSSLLDVLAEASRLVVAAHRSPSADKPSPIPHRPPPRRAAH